MKKNVQYAGFWIRAVADFIDSILLDVVSGILWLMLLGMIYWIELLLGSPAVTKEISFFEVLNPVMLQVLFFSIRGGLTLSYFGWGTYRYGTSLGKQFFKIYVVQYESLKKVSLRQSVIRCFGYLLSYIPFGAGFLMVAFHPEKRALHDLISGTVSVIKSD